MINGRSTKDLGPVDLVDITTQRGAVTVRLSQREEKECPLAVVIEILPLAGEDFVAQAKRFLAGLESEQRADVPTVDGHEGHEVVAFGEVAAFQVAIVREAPLLEMVWSSIERLDAVRCIITSGQLETLVEQVQEKIAAMSKTERNRRMVTLDGWGKSRSVPLEK